MSTPVRMIIAGTLGRMQPRCQVRLTSAGRRAAVLRRQRIAAVVYTFRAGILKQTFLDQQVDGADDGQSVAVSAVCDNLNDECFLL